MRTGRRGGDDAGIEHVVAVHDRDRDARRGEGELAGVGDGRVEAGHGGDVAARDPALDENADRLVLVEIELKVTLPTWSSVQVATPLASTWTAQLCTPVMSAGRSELDPLARPPAGIPEMRVDHANAGRVVVVEAPVVWLIEGVAPPRLKPPTSGPPRCRRPTIDAPGTLMVKLPVAML